MKHKTYYVASDEPELDITGEVALFDTPDEAVDFMVEHWQATPEYVLEVKVTGRAKVRKTKVEFNWETESGAS